MLSWTWEAKAINHFDFTKPAKTKTESMREYNKTYREKHSTTVICGCKAEFKEISKYTHIKTARHMKWLETTKSDKQNQLPNQ